MFNALIIILIVILFVTNLIYIGFLAKQTLEVQDTVPQIGMTILIIIWFILANYIIFMPLWGGLLKKG